MCSRAPSNSSSVIGKFNVTVRRRQEKERREEEEEEEENAILLVYYCYVTSYYYLYYAILFICICFWAASVAMHIFFDRDACEYSPFPDGPTHW